MLGTALIGEETSIVVTGFLPAFFAIELNSVIACSTCKQYLSRNGKDADGAFSFSLKLDNSSGVAKISVIRLLFP